MNNQNELIHRYNKYILELQHDFHQKTINWAHEQHCLNREISKLRQQLVDKDEDAKELVQETITKLINEFQLERNVLLSDLKGSSGREKELEIHIHQLEDELINVQRSINENEQNHTQALVDSIGETFGLLDDFESRLQVFVAEADRYSVENQTLRSDVRRIDEDRCRQLDSIRSAYAEASKALVDRFRHAAEERGQLDEDWQRKFENNFVEIRKLELLMKEKQVKNERLYEELLRQRSQAEQNEKLVEKNLSKIVLEMAEQQRRSLFETVQSINSDLDQLENCLPLLSTTVLWQQRESKNIHVQMTNNLTGLLKQEQIANDRLRGELSRLKVAQKKNNETTEVRIKEKVKHVKNKMTKSYKELKKKEKTLAAELAAVRITCKEKDNMLAEKDKQTEILQSDIKDLQQRLSKQEVDEKEKLTDMRRHLENIYQDRLAEQHQMYKELKENMISTSRKEKKNVDLSAGDPGASISGQRKKKPIVPDNSMNVTRRKAKVHDTIETEYLLVKEKRCTYGLPTDVIDKMRDDLHRKCGLYELPQLKKY